MRNLLLPGFEGGESPPLRRDPSGLRLWRSCAHGLRVEVYTALEGCWLVLAPVDGNRSGSDSLQRVLSRYVTMVQSLRARSPRVRRYDLRAVRLIIQMPEKKGGFVVEAVGERCALEQLRQHEQGQAEFQPLRVREAAKAKGKKSGR